MHSQNALHQVIRLPVLAILLMAVPFYAYAERGFWRLSELPADLPNLTETSKSVFTVTVPSSDKVAVNLTKYPTVAQAMASMSDDQYLVRGERILRERILARCFEAGQKVCPVFSDFELGTIFLVENDGTCFGAFHVFRDVLGGKTDRPIDLIVQDTTGNIIFGSMESEQAGVEFLFPEALNGGKTSSPAFDFISLKLSGLPSTYKPLKINWEESTKPRGTVLHIGYPGKTYDRQKLLKKPDSDGVSLYVTYGPALRVEDYLQRTGKKTSELNPDTLSALDAAILFADSDNYFGMSGGPTLNSNGEITGVTIGSFPVDGSVSDQTSIAAIRTSWIRRLMDDTKEVGAARK